MFYVPMLAKKNVHFFAILYFYCKLYSLFHVASHLSLTKLFFVIFVVTVAFVIFPMFLEKFSYFFNFHFL